MGYTRLAIFGILTVLASALHAQSAPAVLIVRMGNGLRLLDEASNVVRDLPFRISEYDRFSVNRSASVGVATRHRCDPYGGGDLYLLPGGDRPRKLTWAQHFLPGPFARNEFEVYADPALSPSGRSLAFVARPCSSTRHLDVVEAAGVAVIFDQVRGSSQVLQGTTDKSGAPIGFAHTPTWSADESLLYVNLETGFRVLRAADGAVALEYPADSQGEDWSQAVGWLGSRCVVFAEGTDFRAADENQLWVLNMDRRELKRLDSLSDTPGEKVTGVVSVQWPYVISRKAGQLALTRLGRNGFTARLLREVDGAMLVFRESNDLPEFCRP